MKQKLSRTLWFIVGAVWLAAGFWLTNIETQSIWFDEGWSAYSAIQPSVILAANSDATNPPLYYVLINLTARLWGTSEFGLRVTSLLTGLLIIPLTYRLARLHGGRRAGGLAAALAVFSAPLLWAAQEARMYTLLAVLVLLAALAWTRIIRARGSTATWIALLLAELALLYAHNTAPVVVLWLNLVTLIAWITRRRPPLLRWISGQIIVGVLWLPYFITRFVLLADANSAISSAPQIGLSLLAQVWQGFWAAPWALIAVQGDTVVALVALIALGITLISITRRSLPLWTHVIILTGGLVAALIVLGNDLHGRYLIMIIPLTLAAVGVGLAQRPRVLAWGSVLALAILGMWVMRLAADPLVGHDDTRAMVRYYAETLTAEDSVVAWSYADRYDLAYYWDRFDVPVRRVTLPEGADLDAVLPLLPTSGDVALNIWYTQRADYRGMMGCLLANGTVNPPETHTVYGMTTDVYRSPVITPPDMQPNGITFTDANGTPIARLTEAAASPQQNAERAACLPLSLELLRDGVGDLKALISVRNALGWEVARTDAIFATANQRFTSALSAGETVTAFPAIHLPYGAPKGEYSVYLRLYTENDLAGFTPDAAQTVGRDVYLGAWTAPNANWGASTRETTLPNRLDMPFAGDLTLAAHNLPLTAPDTEPPSITNGEIIRAALLWTGSGETPPLTLQDDAGRWSITIPGGEAVEGASLDWRALRVPPEAENGLITLRAGSWLTLARWQVSAQPMITAPPPFEIDHDAAYPELGALVGATVADPLHVELVWRADAAAETSYTVFVQLLDASGSVIAQSDALPAGGSRPTTGWRPGEYILDAHTLTPNDRYASGSGTLIAGLYDSATNTRLRLTNGRDHVVLDENVTIP